MRLTILLPLALMITSLDAAPLEIATLYPPGSEALRSLEAASDRLEAATDGAVSLKVYPGGVMGDDSTVLRKLRIRQLDGALVSSGTLDLLGMDYSDLNQPFQFDSIEAVYEAREHFDTALDTGAIDTLIAPPSAALTLGWHSRLETITDQPVIYTWGILILPRRTLDRLPEADRADTIEVLNLWAETLDADLRHSNWGPGRRCRPRSTRCRSCPPRCPTSGLKLKPNNGLAM